MPRARLLKPGFFLNPDLGEMPQAARLLFAGLWCVADRAGRLVDDPRRLKVQLLPWDDENVDELLDELAGAGFICRYATGGARFIHILNFEKHQHPHRNEPESTLPECIAVSVNSPTTSDNVRSEPDNAGSTPAVTSNLLTVTGNRIAVTGNPDSGAAAAKGTSLIRAWEQATGTLVTALVAERMDAAEEDVGTEWVLDAISETGQAGVKSWKYTAAIIARWKLEGRGPPKDAAPEDAFEARKQREKAATERILAESKRLAEARK
jgi:hypothetical protein